MIKHTLLKYDVSVFIRYQGHRSMTTVSDMAIFKVCDLTQNTDHSAAQQSLLAVNAIQYLP